MSNQNNNFKFRDLPWGWIILGVTLWFMFPWIYSVFFNFILKNPKEYGESFGAVGDIYGSLNALFTSATLAIVVYSTLLQRQANEDARVAMEDQLREARRSSKEQIVQARASTKQQLALAQATHDAQIKESKYAIFSNVFNYLLSYKHEFYLSIQTTKGNKTFQAHEVFTHINIAMFDHVKNEWADISLVTVQNLQQDFHKCMFEISNIKNYSEIFVYLMNIKNLFEFINRSSIEEEDKVFYKKLIIDSMTTGEQVALLWISAYDKLLREFVESEKCLDLSYNEECMPFVVKFHRKESFISQEVQNNWDRFI